MRFDSSTLYSISDVVPLGEISTTQPLGRTSVHSTVFTGIAKGRTHSTVETGSKTEAEIKILPTC